MWTKGVSGGTDPASGISQIPKLPIWTPLLYALLIFLLVELLLSSFASIRRFGKRSIQVSDDLILKPTLDDPDPQSGTPTLNPNRSEVNV